MYGAFYEVDRDPNQKGKKLKDAGEVLIISCSLLFRNTMIPVTRDIGLHDTCCTMMNYSLVSSI